MFDFTKVDNFESHINVSIPNYSGLNDIFTALATQYTQPEGRIIDIGCSTGRFLNGLEKINAEYIGCDVVNIVEHDGFDFILSDAAEYLATIDRADVIVSMFSLQFMGRHKRKGCYKEIKRLVDGGAILLVSEKVFMPSKVEAVLKKEHIQKKRAHFKDSEILDKERDLLSSMHCVTDSALTKELAEIGEAVPVWQSFNFRAYAVGDWS